MPKNILFTLLFTLFLFGCADNTNVATENNFNNQNIIENEVMENNTEAETKTVEADETKEEAPVKEEKKQTKKKKKKKQSTSLPPLTVHYLDVGQADATLFQFSDGDEDYTLLYDTGDWRGNEVLPYLQGLGIDYIDIVMISHPHADHIGQLEKVLQSVEVGEVWMSSNTAESQVYQNAVNTIIEKDIDFDEPSAGDVFDIGSLVLTILHPASLTGKLNEDSISFHAQYGDVSFLFTGDAGKAEEKQMMQRSLPIEATFLQLGHHGSNTSSDGRFVDKVNPEHAIYSAGKNNSYGHPHPDVVNLFQEKDIPLHGTDEKGTIIVTTDGKDYEMDTKQMTKSKQSTTKKPKQEKKKQQATENTATGNCVDINSASFDEVQKIIHIGEARAELLIEARPYNSVDDLTRINGIGPARIDDIKAEGIACVK
ncbi:MAG TPA: MBL fold metallo-hydrolase [Pseudogracilibacillus sp.]|nr:MBL fold metallo-hydrolase [Pseudogracilibacillus sp.]